MDTSDVALAGALQQVQPMKVLDLKGTKAYDHLKSVYEKGKPMPRLVTKLGMENGAKFQKDWKESLDQSEVLVERVIADWSRVCKGPKMQYSATEREALASKEALIKFTPFIEGENITLITNHAALQWARTFENYNQHLAAWGLVFAAFPGLTIVH